jgi:hypothetical protein
MEQINSFSQNENPESQKKYKFVKTKVHSKKPEENEIFISRKRKYKNSKGKLEKFYYQRAHYLIFDKHYKELYINGLGSCLNFAVSTALNLCECIPKLQVENISTETVNHSDYYIEERSKQVEMSSDERKSNLIKIKLIIK